MFDFGIGEEAREVGLEIAVGGRQRERVGSAADEGDDAFDADPPLQRRKGKLVVCLADQMLFPQFHRTNEQNRLHGAPSHVSRPGREIRPTPGAGAIGMPRSEAILTRFRPSAYTWRGRARWGAGGALNPQPASAGSNSLSRASSVGLAAARDVDGKVPFGEER